MYPTRSCSFLSRALLGATLALGSLAAHAYVDIPHPAPVVDLTGTLDAQQTQVLTQRITDLDRQSGSEIEILMLPTTGDESVQSYSWRVAEAWRPGHQGENRGIVVVVAKNDHKSYIQVGTGLEAVIPSDVATTVARDMSPFFRTGDFYTGLDRSLDDFTKLLVTAPAASQTIAPDMAGNSQPAVQASTVSMGDQPVSASQQTAPSEPDWESTVFAIFFCTVALFIAGVAARVLFARFKRSPQSRRSTGSAKASTSNSTGFRPSGAPSATRSTTSPATPTAATQAPVASTAPKAEKAPAPTSAAPSAKPAQDAFFGSDFATRDSRATARPPLSTAPGRAMRDTSNQRPANNRPVTPAAGSNASRSGTSSRDRSSDDGFAAGYVAGSLSASRDTDYYNRNRDDSSYSSSTSSGTSSDSSSNWSSSDSGGSFGGTGGGDSW